MSLLKSRIERLEAERPARPLQMVWAETRESAEAAIAKYCKVQGLSRDDRNFLAIKWTE